MSKSHILRRLISALVLIYCIITPLLAINQQCSNSSNVKNSQPQKVNQNSCPQNSYCSQNGFCVCNQGYFGNCQTKGQFINSNSKQFTVNQNISYYIITPTLNQYVYYQFTLCNLQSQDNEELLNLWSDDGNLVTPTSKNSLGIDKPLRSGQGCTNLMTPFFSFTSQPNGQSQILILGIRLKNPGTLKINLLVQEAELFGFDILFRIILILISGIGIICLGSLVYCILKCRRRGRTQNLNEQRYDISFFNEYMPSKKTKVNQMKEDICAVCLGQYKQNEEIRQTICSHHFHKNCLDQWCVTNLSCPICRTSFQKANLIHYQYLVSNRNTAPTHEETDYNDSNIDESIIQEDIIQIDDNLRKPMV